MNNHRFGSSDQADSAGQPWAGRSFDANPHSGDDGSAPAELVAAIAAFRGGETSLTEVVTAFRAARFLVPLVAEAGDVGFTDEGLKVDKTQELAIVTVASPDGRSALPVFSSVTAMSQWNPDARPVPADGVRVALAAAGEGTPIVVLDAGTPTQLVLRRPALWAIAKGQAWRPPHDDARIDAVVQASVLTNPEIHSVALRDGDPAASLAGPDLAIDLVLEPHLDEARLNELLQRVASSWLEDQYFAEHVDRIGLNVIPADA